MIGKTTENAKLDEPKWYRNHYRCEDCNVDWHMEWDATCDDRCPKCNVSYTPISSEDIPEPKNKLPNREDAGIKQLALDYVENKIFTSANTDPNVVGMVFMPILFGATKGLDPEDIGLIFSYMKDAGPRSINGYPMFMSCGFLNQHDNKLFWEYVDVLNAQRKSFLNHKF